MSGGYWHKDSFWVRTLSRAARSIALLSAIFVVAVTGAVVDSWAEARKSDPLKDQRISALRAVLKANPVRTDLKDEIRRLDYRARKIYFSNMEHVRKGVSLIMLGVVALLLSGGISAELAKRLPSSADTEREGTWRSMSQAWRGVVVFAFSVGIAGIFAGKFLDREMTAGARKPAPKPVAPAVDQPLDDPVPRPVVQRPRPVAPRPVPLPRIDPACARNWSGFLGPLGRGVATDRQAPRAWAYVGESNLLWSVLLDRYGYSSPIVWDDDVFITEADSDERNLVCLDLESGEVKWRAVVGPYDDTPEDLEELSDDNMYAAATPVTDGKHIYVIFSNGDIACIDFEGNEVWGRNLWAPVIDYGYSSSPVLSAGKLIIQLELDTGPYLAALDAGTGEEEWRTKRPDSSWATPLVYIAGESTLLICASVTAMSAYSLEDGHQEWVVPDCFSGEVGSSVAVEGNIAYITSLSEGVRAYRLGKQPKLIWQWDEDPSEMASPLAYVGYVYIASQSGNVVCLDRFTGEEQWSVETDREFYASPVCIDGVIYAVNRDGMMVILKAGKELEEIGRMQRAEKCDAIPAFAGSKVIIRAPDEVICYGK